MDGRDWMGVHFEHTWYSLARAKAGSCLPRGGVPALLCPARGGMGETRPIGTAFTTCVRSLLHYANFGLLFSVVRWSTGLIRLHPATAVSWVECRPVSFTATPYVPPLATSGKIVREARLKYCCSLSSGVVPAFKFFFLLGGCGV